MSDRRTERAADRETFLAENVTITAAMGARTVAAKRPGLAFAYRPSHAEGVFSPEALRELGQLCQIVDAVPLENFTSPAARQALATADILVTGWGCPRIDSSVLAAAPRLRLVAHAAGSVKGFVAPEVFAAGIKVCNAASANAIPVAEFTLASILFANKRVLRYRDLYREQRGALSWSMVSSPDVGNFRKLVGIVGYSRIGARVVELLKPHDLDVIVYDPYRPAAETEALGLTVVGLDELMARADVVSLHAPAIEETHHMIDARRLSLMRDGATLINTARGSLVDHAALERELVAGRLSAVLDVTTPEVLPAGSVLYELPNVLLTPHIAGALGRERERLGALVVAEIERFIGGAPLAHAVSADTLHLQA